ncbi:hypothetical protein GCM10009836_39980 [Pseudonocardia ailaonensis]|uniref:VOC domain-containing protein n=1 Tax=Pseudonocardia ailaonensis TaxID=367279 RepID=A0ABN2N732_9PSEU
MIEHGQVCYLQLPTTDVEASKAFYAGVFGWTVDDGTGFEAPGVIGQWITDRPVADAGPLLWIAVSDMDRTLAATTEHGGTHHTAPFPDGDERTLAVVRDPSGTELGLASHP